MHCGAPLVVAPTEKAQSERRQLTVMFCDMIDSTGIAERIDPEDFRDLLVEYRGFCDAIIATHHGRVPQYLGDGIVAHFGFPEAREDDVALAIRAGLAICAGLPPLAERLERRYGEKVGVRIGINTGSVVIDGGGRDGDSVGLTGGSLNVAARLQEQAAPNTVVISQDTWQLVRGQFLVESLGGRALKGILRPIELFRVLGQTEARTLFEARAAGGLSRLTGRAEQIAALSGAWAAATGARGQSVLLVGEAGIGKSRLIHEFRQEVDAQAAVSFGWNCYHQYQNTPFYPVAQELARAFAIDANDDEAARLEKIRAGIAALALGDPETAPDVALIFGDAPGAGGAAQTPEARARLLPVLTGFIKAMAARVPLLLTVEDLHWADPSTLELLSLLAASIAGAPLMLLATARTDAPVPPGFETRLDLTRLSSREATTLIAAVCGETVLPTAVVTTLIERADGVPLFIEELTRSVCESLEGGERSVTDTAASLVPASLQDSLMARLDRLGRAKEVAQIAAVIGRRFDLDLLASLWSGSREDLDAEIEHLLDAELIWPVETSSGAQANQTAFEFKHELVRNIASGSLMRAARRAMHHRVAEALETRFPAEAARHPEVLAYHHGAAGDVERALALWQIAGTRALRASANMEAVGHIGRALDLVADGPANAARDAIELDLQLNLAAALMAAKGYTAPELERTVDRAMALGQRAEDRSKLFPLIYGRWSFLQTVGRIEPAYELAEQFVALTQSEANPEYALVGHRMIGASQHMKGELVDADLHLREALRLLDPEAHARRAHVWGSDLLATSWIISASVEILLGRLDEAYRHGVDACARARSIDHANSFSFCASYQMAMLGLAGREAEYAAILDEQAAHVQRHQMPLWATQVDGYRGWQLVRHGDAATAVPVLQRAVESNARASFHMWRSLPLQWLGEAHALLGNWDDAEDAFALSAKTIDATNTRWSLPDLLGVWGMARLRAGRDDGLPLIAKGLATAAAQRSWLFADKLAGLIAGDERLAGLHDNAQQTLANLGQADLGRASAAA